MGPVPWRRGGIPSAKPDIPRKKPVPTQRWLEVALWRGPAMPLQPGHFPDAARSLDAPGRPASSRAGVLTEVLNISNLVALPANTSYLSHVPEWVGQPPPPPTDATHTPSCQPHGQIAARIHCRYATTLQMAQKRADAESSRPQLRVPRNRIHHRPTQCRISSTGSPLCGTFLDTKFATQFRTVDVSVAFCHFVAPRQAAACFKSGH